MLQLNIPRLEEDILASSIRRYQSRLKEVLDAIERRDMSSDEIRITLEWVAKGLSDIRKKMPVLS